MDSAMDEQGAAAVAEFTRWIADRQQAEAKMLKAGCIWREERATDAKWRGGDKGTANRACG